MEIESGGSNEGGVPGGPTIDGSKDGGKIKAISSGFTDPPENSFIVGSKAAGVCELDGRFRCHYDAQRLECAFNACWQRSTENETLSSQLRRPMPRSNLNGVNIFRIGNFRLFVASMCA
jgi:hypothetical protein